MKKEVMCQTSSE